MLEPVTLTAPSAWASFLINGDDSGLEPEDRQAVLDWLAREEMDWPVSCDDYGFTWHHDAWKECPFGADCQTYTFLVERA